MIGPLVNGIILGSIITLGAIGVTLVADILNFFNFAHGAIFTLGAYFTYLYLNILPDMGSMFSLSFGGSMLIAIVLSMASTSVVVLFFDKIIFRTLRQRDASSLFLALTSLGLVFVMKATISMIWGPQVHYYGSIQSAIKFPLGIRVKPDEFFIVAASLILVLVTYLFLKYTRLGKAMRATSDNVVLAQASGVGTEKIVTWTWIMSASLAALGGTLYGIEVQIRPTMGWSFLIPMFVAVIVGGVGSFGGALVGGMIIGISEELITSLLQDMFLKLNIRVVMSAYKPAIAFVLIIFVLLVRPHGIFGRKGG
ncbi:branched-chain amino acid ABC transporter permease [Candidatus Bipolaricaulota bacterium]|nr:branched-chain amino acid ABC transporter permease [Candidatus Bipolaricaulota bacterium]MBS3792933.1 branched-chain amino acid ABC transporter permease [Candidatus Bipolaricaulota bacterium]